MAVDELALDPGIHWFPTFAIPSVPDGSEPPCAFGRKSVDQSFLPPIQLTFRSLRSGLTSARSTAYGSLWGKKNPCFLETKVSNIFCDFGCERRAIKQLKNGRFVCAEFSAQCPALRAKNSAANRGKNPFANRPHPRGMAGKVPWNRGLKWEEMYDPDVLQRQQAARAARIESAQRALI